MKPAIAEIEAVFTADGGVLARRLHESISEGLAKDKATQIATLMDELVAEDHPLRSEKFRKWDRVIKAAADKEWKELKDLKSPETKRFQRTRYAVCWWLELLFPELKPQPSGDNPAVPPEEELRGHPRSHTDVDLNNALEEYAMKVAEDHYARLLGQDKVMRVNHIPGALDLLLHFPGRNRRVEVKGRRRRSAQQVEVTWREVERSQKEETCILFVVDSIDVDAGNNNKCSGGWWREYPDWRVYEGDADLKATDYLYTLGKSAASGQVKAT